MRLGVPLAPARTTPGDGTSYLFFPETKPDGVIRIGVFGCSFVEGAEALDGLDFPSLLRSEFERAGMDSVEVINFGVSGFGIHQSYLMWQVLGAKYDLDYTIFNFWNFHRERDNTFIQLGDSYGPLHARYILVEDRIELIDVVGIDWAEASARYFSLLPPWRYIRYDSKAPPLLRSVVPRYRFLPNPLYPVAVGGRHRVVVAAVTHQRQRRDPCRPRVAGVVRDRR